MSLDNGSKILLIQGPPCTGKTATITEMLLQLLDRHRHWKILVASQSNQAVDNVLEKVCQKEEKILRIGNRSSGIGGYDVWHSRSCNDTHISNACNRDGSGSNRGYSCHAFT